MRQVFDFFRSIFWLPVFAVLLSLSAVLVALVIVDAPISLIAALSGAAVTAAILSSKEQ